MIFYFIRHGQTDWNVEGRIQGCQDCELNTAGIAQAAKLGKKVLKSNIRFSKIYTSKKKRALRTAEILGEITNTEYIPTDGLEEINFGDWEGLTWAQIEEKFPDKYRQWNSERRYTNTPNGESYQQMLERVLSALHKIIASNSESVAIVTHGAVIMGLLCYITNSPFDETGKFKPDNTDIVEIDSSRLVCQDSVCNRSAV